MKKYERETKKELIQELTRLQRRLTRLEKSLAKTVQAGDAGVKSDIRFKSLIENSFECIAILGRDGTINYVSPSVKRILGYDPKNIIGKDVFGFIHPDDVERVRGIFLKGLDIPDFLESLDLRLRSKSGKWRLLETTGKNLLANSAVNGFVVNFQDITERRQKEERMKLLSSASENSPESIYITDVGGKIIYVNKSAALMARVSVDKLLGENIDKFFKNRKFVHEIINTVLEKGFFEGEYITKDFEGGDKWIYSVNSIVRNDSNKPIGIVGIARDITERKIEEKNKAQYVLDLQMLSETAMAFVESDPDENIYDIIAKNLKKLVGKAVISVNSYNPVENTLKIEAVAGFGKNLSKASVLVGYNLVGSAFPLDDEGKYALSRGLLERVDQGISQLSSGKISKNISGKIESLLRIGECHAIGFQSKGQLFGSATILAHKDCKPLNVNAIEAYIKQASVALQRRRAEEALREIQSIYRLLAENVSDVIWVNDLNMRPLYNSPSMKRLVGYSDEEIRDIGMEGLLTPDSVKLVTNILLEELAIENAKVKDLKRSRTVECEFVRKDGIIVPVEIKATFIRDRNAKAVGILGITRDITERKRLERMLREHADQLELRVRERTAELEIANKALRREIIERRRTEVSLRESEEKYRTLFEDSKDAIYISSKEGKFLDLNQAAIELFGYPKEELLNLDLRVIYADPADRALFQAEIEAKGSVRDYEVRLCRKDGSVMDCLMTSSVRRDENGEVIGYQGIIRDITERNKWENELKIRNSAIESSLNAIMISNLEAEITYINPAFLKLWGYSRKEEIIGRNAIEFWKDGQKAEKVIEELNGKGAWSGEMLAKRKDGAFFDAHLSASLVKDIYGRPVCITANFINVTDSKAAEEAFRETEARYKALFDRTLYGVFIFDFKGNFIDANDTALDMAGYDRDDIEDLNLASLLEDKDVKKVYETMNEIIKRGSQEQFSEYRLRRKDGEYIWVETEASLIYHHGKPYALQGIARDITARKRAEETLKSSEERFRSLVESSIAGISISTRDNKPIYVNRALLSICGYKSQEELLSTPIEKILTPDTMSMVNENYKRISRGEDLSRQIDVSIIRKDGQVRHLEVSVANVEIENENYFLAIYIDVTERKKIEEELMKAQKLESIGLLAGGIAHDFNNFMMAVSGNLSLAMMKMSGDDKSVRHLEEADRACVQARNLTQQLLTLSRGGAPVRKTASMALIIKNSAGFCLRGTNVRCDLDIADDLWPVEVDFGQMSQVMNNLIINSMQAMPEGGIINISAENLEIFDDEILPLTRGRYVMINLRDHGSGIPSENLQKIFDPYFTTKDGGYGLGLATTYSIIKKHEGYIDVESEPGVGTSFKMYIPASMKKPVSSLEEKFQPTKGEGRILVMDGDRSVREVAREMLNNLGYETEAAGEGAEAIEMYKKAMASGKPFDAVIMDLIVQNGMGGKEAVKKIIELDPGAKVIISSGYSNIPVMTNSSEYGFCAAITKPYKIKELSSLMADILS